MTDEIKIEFVHFIYEQEVKDDTESTTSLKYKTFLEKSVLKLTETQIKEELDYDEFIRKRRQSIISNIKREL